MQTDSVVHPTSRVEVAMPQLIALEWDSREIRMMVASGRGRQVVVEQALAVPYEIDAADAPSGQGDSPIFAATTLRAVPEIGTVPEQIGRRIAAELHARGLTASDAVVAVGRNSIELRQLQLPPATDEDLPDLVRFQAMREFNELDDAWRLDFVPIEGSADTPRTVLATAIAPGVLAQCEAVCRHAGLKMRRLLLRPCEAALLLKGQESIPRGQAALLVDFLGSEAELTAAVDGTAVFLHTARISDNPPPVQALLAEIRLTMAAAFNQLDGRRIESIVLCGLPQSHLELACASRTSWDCRSSWSIPLARCAWAGRWRRRRRSTRAAGAAGGHGAGRIAAGRARGRFPPSPPPRGAAQSARSGRLPGPLRLCCCWHGSSTPASIISAWPRASHTWSSNRGSWTGSLTTPSGPMPRRPTSSAGPTKTYTGWTASTRSTRAFRRRRTRCWTRLPP